MKPDSKRAKTEDPYAVPPAFLALLARTKATSLRPKDNKLFVASRKDLVADVWAGLLDHRFLSVPVLQKSKSKWYGFVDLADIATFFVEHFGEAKLTSEADYRRLAAETKTFAAANVDAVMRYPLTRRNPFHPVLESFSLLSAVELLARIPSLPRVPIISTDRRLKGLITRSAMVSFLQSHRAMLGPKLEQPISGISRSGKVITVPGSIRAIDAFAKLTDAHINGLAVVDDSGKLVDTLSIRDMKGVDTDGKFFHHLFGSVTQFLHHLSASTYFSTKVAGPRVLLTLEPKATFGEALDTLQKAKVHQVFVVDAAGKPEGVVGLQDLLLSLFE